MCSYDTEGRASKSLLVSSSAELLDRNLQKEREKKKTIPRVAVNVVTGYQL